MGRLRLATRVRRLGFGQTLSGRFCQSGAGTCGRFPFAPTASLAVRGDSDQRRIGEVANPGPPRSDPGCDGRRTGRNHPGSNVRQDICTIHVANSREDRRRVRTIATSDTENKVTVLLETPFGCIVNLPPRALSRTSPGVGARERACGRTRACAGAHHWRCGVGAHLIQGSARLVAAICAPEM